MENENSTEVTEFILAGLTQSQNIQLLVFALVLIFYLIILPGNFLIILTIRSDPSLTAPLYFFLGNLAFLDASYSFIVGDMGSGFLLSTGSGMLGIASISLRNRARMVLGPN